MDNRTRQTVPVVVEDENLSKSVKYVILYNKSEVEVMSAIFCANEDMADKFMREFEREGTLTLPTFTPGRKMVIEPFMMLKTEITRAIVKQYRQVELPNPNIVE